MEATDKNKKVEEPFDPENTPSPAQFSDPNMREKSEQNNAGAIGNKGQQKDDKRSKPAEEQPGEKRLGESEIEIDDETTI